MIANVLDKFRAWFFDTFTYEPAQEAADAMADATRWGWLPALSGVAVGAGQTRCSHAGSRTQGSEMSG